MRNLYNGIKARIQAECPSIEYIDMWRNQVERMKEGKILDFRKPAVFIRFLASEVLSVGNGIQVYEPLIVEIHTVHEFFNGNDTALNLDVFDVVGEVHASLHNWALRGGNSEYGSGVFVRTSVEFDDDHDNIYHHITTYTTSWTDNSGKVDGKLFVEPVLTTEITASFVEPDAPVLTATPTSLDFGSVEIGQYSTNSFVLSAVNTFENIIIGTGGGFEVSLYEDSGFTTRLILTPTDGRLEDTTIYCKFSPSIARSYSGAVTYGTMDSSAVVELSGVGVAEINFLLLQSGDNFLLQNGDNLII